MHWTTLIDFHVCHRITSVRKLYSVTLIYLFNVQNCSERCMHSDTMHLKKFEVMMPKLFLELVSYIAWKQVEYSSIEVQFEKSGISSRFCKGIGRMRRAYMQLVCEIV